MKVLQSRCYTVNIQSEVYNHNVSHVYRLMVSIYRHSGASRPHFDWGGGGGGGGCPLNCSNMLFFIKLLEFYWPRALIHNK